jgi:ADP-ribosylglycohydrolase
MREVIREGGDTDTNACIVGGMIGAYLGHSALPKDMVDNLLSFDCSDNGILRPDFLNTKY